MAMLNPLYFNQNLTKPSKFNLDRINDLVFVHCLKDFHLDDLGGKELY